MFDLAYLSAVHVLFRSKRTGMLTVIMPCAAVMNIALNVVLIPRWGLTGAAVSTLVAYAVAGATSRLAARRVTKVVWIRAASSGRSAPPRSESASPSYSRRAECSSRRGSSPVS